MLKSRGFSLIELLVSISVLAVIMALAAPSFGSLLTNAQIRTASQGVCDGIQLARTEAIRRNTRVDFVLGAGGSWTITQESDGGVIQTRPPRDGSTAAVVITATPSNATTLTFDGIGRMRANTDSSSSLGQLDFASNSNSGRPLRIVVNAGGAARLCDPNAAAGTGTACT